MKYRFKGTILITDPCYIIDHHEDKRPKFETWPGLEEVTSYTKFVDYTKEQKEAYDKFEKARDEFNIKYDDWSRCHNGFFMERLGIINYITKTTIYGDWSCTVYAANNPKEIVDKIAKVNRYIYDRVKEYGGYDKITPEQADIISNECNKVLESIPNQIEPLGNFCADAGLVSVLLLDEVLAYNPKVKDLIKECDWAATVIKDFDGEIEYYIDEVDEAHIIGTGSHNFFTTQTNL